MLRILLNANMVGRELPRIAKTGIPSEAVLILDGVREQALAAAWLALAEDQASRQAVDQYLREWRHVQPKTDGNALRAMGLSPGPSYKRILWRLRAAWLDGQISSKKDEQELLSHLAEEQKAQPNSPTDR